MPLVYVFGVLCLIIWGSGGETDSPNLYVAVSLGIVGGLGVVLTGCRSTHNKYRQKISRRRSVLERLQNFDETAEDAQTVLCEAFKVFDRDSSGDISPREMHSVLKAIYPSIPRGVVQKMLEDTGKLVTDSEGHVGIGLEDFLDAIRDCNALALEWRRQSSGGSKGAKLKRLTTRKFSLRRLLLGKGSTKFPSVTATSSSTSFSSVPTAEASLEGGKSPACVTPDQQRTAPVTPAAGTFELEEEPDEDQLRL